MKNLVSEFRYALEWVGLVGLQPKQVKFATRVGGRVQNLPSRVLTGFPVVTVLLDGRFT